MGEFFVISRNIGKHICDSITHHWEFLGHGPPPDTIRDVVDQQVNFVFVKDMA